MIEHNYNLDELNKLYEHDLKLPIGNAVVTTETGTDMYVNGVWKPETALVIAMGVVHNNHLQIFCRTEENEPEFEEMVYAMLEQFRIKNVELWAFNKTTEEGNFFGMFGKHYLFNEIRPTPKRWRRNSYFKALFSKRILTKGKIINETFTNSSEVIRVWQKYQQHKDNALLAQLVQHILNGLIMETVIFKHREELQKKIEEADKSASK